MLSKKLRDQLDSHRRSSLLWRPLRDLRTVRTISHGEFDTYVGERPDGTFELIREASGEQAVELLLNEIETARNVQHEGLVDLLWTCRTGRDRLALSYAWQDAYELAFPLDLRWLLRAFIAISRAVAALHDAGVVHADLKTDAVCWTEDPARVKVWDLRMAQEPGPRRFDAFSARFAAPEQVAGGDLHCSSDVYALGVMLYSLFIRSRFPTILLPSTGGSQSSSLITSQPGLGSITEGPRLSAATNLYSLDELAGAAEPQSDERGDTQTVLGAKIYFAHELDRVIARTRDIGLAEQLLGVIERATEQKPVDRYPDAAAFGDEIAGLLDRATVARPANSTTQPEDS